MPGKSKHGKGKHYRNSKKSKKIQRQDTVAAPAATAVAPKPAASISTAPAGKAAASPVNVKTHEYAYVPGDLRRTGILTGIIIVILIALYFILS